MTTFMVDVNFEKSRYACFVQKVFSKEENVYILNLTDSSLIKRFNGKKLLLSQSRINVCAEHTSFEQNAWNAILQREQYTEKTGKHHIIKFL